MLDISNDFHAKHPDFLGIKIIVNIHRSLNTEELALKMKVYQELQLSIWFRLKIYTLINMFYSQNSFRNKFPSFVIGFDLVGQEDCGKPLIDFMDQLKDYSQEGKYFFHAGETSGIIIRFQSNLFL